MYFGLNPMLIFTQKVGLRKIFNQNPMYFGLNPMLISGGGSPKVQINNKKFSKNFARKKNLEKFSKNFE